MNTVLIRDATITDLPVLKKFEQEIIKAERPFDPTIKPDPVNYYDLGQYILDEDCKVVVAEVSGVLVASGYALIKKARLYLDHTDYGYLGFMYTEPGFRGRGINHKITEHLKEWCRTKGLLEVRLTVYHDNDPAIRAYEKAGFSGHLNEMRLRLKK